MKKILKIGLDFSAPVPMHTDISSASFEGFEVDMMQMIASELDVALSYEVMLWKDILHQLELGKLDCICSAVTVTDEREKFLGFSDPYLEFNLVIVARKTSTASFQNSQSLRIGLRSATEAERYALFHFPLSKHVIADTNDELYRQLSEHKIDFIIDDEPIAGALVEKFEALIIQKKLPDTRASYAVATRKGNTTLCDQINQTLRKLKKSKEWSAMNQRWHVDAS